MEEFELKLTVLEQRSFERGLAPERVRLKAGRIVWDRLMKQLPLNSKGEADADHLMNFRAKVEDGPYYEKAALKEWLNAQIENYPETLGGNTKELQRQIKIYKEHLEALKG